MKISVIMPSYLGNYAGAANDRENKFRRAVNSFLKNTHYDKELVVVSDGCDRTDKILTEEFSKASNIILLKIKKQPLFSGNVRQTGIEHSKGDIICYLDTDDMLGATHISCINKELSESESDWIFFNDYLYNGPLATQNMREVALIASGCGVSNIAHKKLPQAHWKGCDGMGHDWEFIERLRTKYRNYRRTYGMTYYVCHRAFANHDK